MRIISLVLSAIAGAVYSTAAHAEVVLDQGYLAGVGNDQLTVGGPYDVETAQIFNVTATGILDHINVGVYNIPKGIVFTLHQAYGGVPLDGTLAQGIINTKYIQQGLIRIDFRSQGIKVYDGESLAIEAGLQTWDYFDSPETYWTAEYPGTRSVGYAEQRARTGVEGSYGYWQYPGNFGPYSSRGCCEELEFQSFIDIAEPQYQFFFSVVSLFVIIGYKKSITAFHQL